MTRRVHGTGPARNLLAAKLSPGEQRAVGELRETVAVLDRLIETGGDWSSHRAAQRQRERLRAVWIDLDRTHIG